MIIVSVCVFVSKKIDFLADATFQSSSLEYFFCHQSVGKVVLLLSKLLFFTKVAKAGSA